MRGTWGARVEGQGAAGVGLIKGFGCAEGAGGHRRPGRSKKGAQGATGGSEAAGGRGGRAGLAAASAEVARVQPYVGAACGGTARPGCGRASSSLPVQLPRNLARTSILHGRMNDARCPRIVILSSHGACMA